MTSGINLEDLKKNMNHVDIKSVMEKLNIEIKIEKKLMNKKYNLQSLLWQFLK